MSVKIYVDNIFNGEYMEATIWLSGNTVLDLPPTPEPPPVTPPVVPPTPPTQGINMTVTGRQPLYLSQSVSGGGQANFYAVMDKAYTKVVVYLEDRDSGSPADMDLIISNVRQPLRSDIVRGSYSNGAKDMWFGPLLGRSNETISIRIPTPAGTVIYATVLNFTESVTGRFILSWSAS